MRLGCNRSKIDLALHTGLRFRHRASIYRSPKILGTSAQIFSGPIHLHGDNWQCRTQKLSVRYQTFGVPCQFFGACKWGFMGFKLGPALSMTQKKQKVLMMFKCLNKLAPGYLQDLFNERSTGL